MDANKKTNIAFKIVGMMAILLVAGSIFYYFVIFSPQEQEQQQYDACMTAWNNENGPTQARNEVEAVMSGNASETAGVDQMNTWMFNEAENTCKQQFPKANENDWEAT